MTSSRGTAANAEADARRKKEEESVVLPAGFAQTFPGIDKEGTLVPRLELTLNAPTPSLRSELSKPRALAVTWPITGRVKRVRSCKIATLLTWLVKRSDGTEKTVQVRDAALVVDGGGAFEVRVGNGPPRLDLLAAGVVTEGRVGFSLAFPDLVRAETIRTFDGAGGIDFNVPCRVGVKLDRPEDVRLGDRATFTVERDGPLAQADLTLQIVERDDNEIGLPTIAMELPVPRGKNELRPWRIGFKDAGATTFSYAEGSEIGDFEYAWELWGKSVVDGQLHRLLSTAAPLIVKRPLLASFEVMGDDSGRSWQARGQIVNGPRDGLRVVLAMHDPLAEFVRAPAKWRAALGPLRTVRVDHEGKFAAQLEALPRKAMAADGPPPSIARGVAAADATKVALSQAPQRVVASGTQTAAHAPAEPEPFGVLTLAALARAEAPDQFRPIGGLLDFDEDTFARFDRASGPTWDENAPWICSAGWSASASRPPRPKRQQIDKVDAPGPEAGGDQSSAMTNDEIWQDVIAWEDIKGHMYRDSSKEGFVTVGAGNKFSVPQDAVDVGGKYGVRWKNRATGMDATEKEILTAYKTVREKFPPGMAADKYRIKPAIELDGGDIRTLAEKRFEGEFLPRLQTKFTEFNAYPKCVRRALFDIGYNAGVGSFDGWNAPLAAAVRARTWDVAVTLVPQGGRPARRQWRQSLFAYAHQIAPRGQVGT